MIAEPGSYAIGDFIPFTAEAYYRQFERLNELMWPAHFAAIAFGIIAVALLPGRRGRYGIFIVAIAWASVAVSFHFRLYAELMPAAGFFGWMFLVQAALILAWSLSHRRVDVNSPRGPVRLGYGFTVFGVLFYPALAPLTGRGWAGAEYFGIAPDPTAVTTLGIVLIAARPRWFASLLPLMLLWCAISGATVWAFDGPLPWVLPAAALIAIGGAVWRLFAKRRG